VKKIFSPKHCHWHLHQPPSTFLAFSVLPLYFDSSSFLYFSVALIPSPSIYPLKLNQLKIFMNMMPFYFFLIFIFDSNNWWQLRTSGSDEKEWMRMLFNPHGNQPMLQSQTNQTIK
jgi:hypothetical protein